MGLGDAGAWLEARGVLAGTGLEVSGPVHAESRMLTANTATAVLSVRCTSSSMAAGAEVLSALVSIATSGTNGVAAFRSRIVIEGFWTPHRSTADLKALAVWPKASSAFKLYG